MTYPTKGTPVQTQFASTVTNMPVNLPASISAGDLLIALVEVRNAGTFTKPANWQDLDSQLGGSSVGKLTAFYKIADGTEGATATWTASTGTTAVWQVIKITGWHGTTPPELAKVSGDYTTNPNPPNLSPSWGAEETLWLEIAGNTAGANLTTGASTNYTGYQLNSASSGGAQCNIASAHRELNASSEDPGAFASAANIRYWASFTIAIRPAGESGPTTISVSDSGSGSEALSFLNNALLSETGIAVEVWTLYHPREYITIEELSSATEKIIEEVGTGNDIISIIAMISQTDSGSANEVFDILNNLIINESASASDLLSILVLISQADTATGSDTSLLTILLTISEAGLGAESIGLLNQLLIADTASSSEAMGEVSVIDQEQTSINDVTNFGWGSRLALTQSFQPEITGKINDIEVKIKRYNNPNDSVILSIYDDDGGSPGNLLAVSDNAVLGSLLGTTSTIINFQFTNAIEFLKDSSYWMVMTRTGEQNSSNYYVWDYQYKYDGTDPYSRGKAGYKWDTAWEIFDYGSEYQDFYFRVSMIVPQLLDILNIFSLDENATGGDSLLLSAILSLQETGSGTDLLALLNNLAIIDLGEAVDILNILNQLSISDIGSVNDLVNILGSIEKTDNASATESLNILNTLNIGDNATGSDVVDLLLLLKELTISESGVGADEVSAVGSALIELTDNASAQDILYILNSISKSEAGHGIESLDILEELNISDSAIGNEFLETLSENGVFDNASATDIIAKYLVKIYNKRNNPYGGRTNPYTKKVFPFSPIKNIYTKKSNPFSIKN